jgi:hypothetical protein
MQNSLYSPKKYVSLLLLLMPYITFPESTLEQKITNYTKKSAIGELVALGFVATINSNTTKQRADDVSQASTFHTLSNSPAMKRVKAIPSGVATNISTNYFYKKLAPRHVKKIETEITKPLTQSEYEFPAYLALYFVSCVSKKTIKKTTTNISDSVTDCAIEYMFNLALLGLIEDFNDQVIKTKEQA